MKGQGGEGAACRRKTHAGGACDQEQALWGCEGLLSRIVRASGDWQVGRGQGEEPLRVGGEGCRVQHHEVTMHWWEQGYNVTVD